MPIVTKITTKDRESISARDAYRLLYLKGRRILAPKGSLGCMCFKSKNLAIHFSLLLFTYVKQLAV